jgi:hypothetical protein
MIDRKTARHAGWAIALCLVCAGAHAESFENGFARDFVQAWSHAAWDDVGFAIHPDEADRVRKLALTAVETEARDGGKEIRARLFGAAVSVDDLRRMTPKVTMIALVKRYLTAPRAVKKTEIVGMVKESDKLHHFVVRGWEDEHGRGASSVLLVSLMPYGKQWAAAVPVEVEEKIEAAIAGGEVGARDTGESHVAALDPGIAKLLDSGIAALKEGRCSDYYGLMSQSFRTATSPAAFKALIAQCEKNSAQREKIRLTLEIVHGLKPRYEYDNTRAVFDLHGQGLPFERFVVEQVDHKWYIAE